MIGEFYEPADFESDPLVKLLRNDGDDEEVDILESYYRSAQHRTRTSEKDRDAYN